MTMKEDNDPDIIITDVWELTYTMEDINEPVSETRLSQASFRRMTLHLDQIEHTARSIFISRNCTMQPQSGLMNTSRDSGMVVAAAKEDTGHHVSHIKCFN